MRATTALLWGALTVLAVLILGLYGQRGFRAVADYQARQAQMGKVAVLVGGDVSLRDVPKVCEILRGGVFRDSYYRGEAHWYP